MHLHLNGNMYSVHNVIKGLRMNLTGITTKSEITNMENCNLYPFGKCGFSGGDIKKINHHIENYHKSDKSSVHYDSDYDSDNNSDDGSDDGSDNVSEDVSDGISENDLILT